MVEAIHPISTIFSLAQLSMVAKWRMAPTTAAVTGPAVVLALPMLAISIAPAVGRIQPPGTVRMAPEAAARKIW